MVKINTDYHGTSSSAGKLFYSAIFFNAINGPKKIFFGSQTVKSVAPYSVTRKVGGKYLFVQ